MEYIDGLAAGLDMFWQAIKSRPGIMYLAVIIAVIISILIICDRENEDSTIASSLTRCMRRFIVLLTDVVGDIISIFSSMTEILNLIRILVFGKVDSQTQIFLANYAIIFMSVVSYFTTMKGLMLVLDDWSAILASFGIQVGILVFSSRLARLAADHFPDEKKTKYVYRVKNAMPCNCDGGSAECPKVLKPKDQNTVYGPNHSVHEWVGIIAILVSLILCSSFFSYNAFWEKFVLPSVPLKEYANARVSVSEVEEEYSKTLREYQQGLEDILNRVNNTVLENIDVNYAKSIKNQIQELDTDIDELEAQIDEAEEEILTLDDESAEWDAINEKIEGLESDLKECEQKRDELNEEQESNYTCAVNDAIEFLSAFYADPLNEEIIFSDVRRQWGNLQAALSQLDNGKDLFSTEQKTDLDTVLNNYLELCQYYRSNGFAGFKMNESIEDENFSEDYNEHTRNILHDAIISLEQTPSFEAVKSIWDEQIVEETSKTQLMEKLYADYRDCSKDVRNTEKAIRALVTAITSLRPASGLSLIERRSKGITLFVAGLAIFIDTTIVLISLWRGNKNTNRSISELRRLVGILFIKKEKERSEENKRMQLSIAFGLLFGVLMFAVQQLLPLSNSELDDNIYLTAFLYAFCGIVAAIVISKAIGKAKKATDPENSSNDEINDAKDGRIELCLFDGVTNIFKAAQWKTICVINAKTRLVENEKDELCVEVLAVDKEGWGIEFAMLESYKVIYLSEDGRLYIIKDLFWKMLYTNALDRMAGNLTLPMSVEDLMNYEDGDEGSI